MGTGVSLMLSSKKNYSDKVKAGHSPDTEAAVANSTPRSQMRCESSHASGDLSPIPSPSDPPACFSQSFPLSYQEENIFSTLSGSGDEGPSSQRGSQAGDQTEAGTSSVYVEQDSVLMRVRALLSNSDLQWDAERLAQLLNLEELLTSGANVEDLQTREDLYLSLLLRFFQLLEIGKDGNCYFVSVHIALLAAEAIDCGRPVIEVCNMLRENLQDYVTTFIAADAMRQGALQTMRANPSSYSGDILDLMESSLGSSDTDATSLQLRERVLSLLNLSPESVMALHPQQLTAQFRGFDKATLLEVYFSVMGQSGIFGERLELRALSHHCGRPIHLYYHTSWEQMLSFMEIDSPEPSETFGAHFPGRPLLLFHTVCGRHFHVLVDREGSGTDAWAGLAEVSSLGDNMFQASSHVIHDDGLISGAFGKHSSGIIDGPEQFLMTC